jgi:hypothetical protein
MLDNTDQREAHAGGKTRLDLEYAPHRTSHMTALTPAAEDITRRGLGRILLFEAGQGRRKRSAAHPDCLRLGARSLRHIR